MRRRRLTNKCGEANTVIDLAERKYSVRLSAIAAAYATAWQNHYDMLTSLERAYKLFEEITIGAFLAMIPGGISGAIGKALNGLGTSAFIVDGVKDLVKAELRQNPGPLVSTNPGQLFKPIPTNPLVWQNCTNQRAQEELAKATEALLSWQNSINQDENVDFGFDPVEKIRDALTIDGQSMLTLEPPDLNATMKKFEAAWLLIWIKRHWFETAIHLIPVTTKGHMDKIANYGKSLGLDGPKVKELMNDEDRRAYMENNERAIKMGHLF